MTDPVANLPPLSQIETAAELLARARAAGVRPKRTIGGLRLLAGEHAPELRTALRKRTPEVLRELEREERLAEPRPPPDPSRTKEVSP